MQFRNGWGMFDAARRENCGIPQKRPAWVAGGTDSNPTSAPSTYPITSVPFGALWDMRSGQSTITVDGSGNVESVASLVQSPFGGHTTLWGLNTTAPQTSTTSAYPATGQYLLFDGTDDYLASGEYNLTSPTGFSASFAGVTLLADYDAAHATTSAITQTNPTSLSLTGLFLGYSAPPPWAGTASSGSSGSNSLKQPGPFPANGTALNGHGTASFNGTTQYLEGNTGETLGTYISATAFTFMAVVNFSAAVTDTFGGASPTYQDAPCLLVDSNFNLAIAFTTSGITAQLDIGGGNPVYTATMACSTGAWHFVCVVYDGTDLTVSVDGVTTSAGALGVGYTLTTTGTITVGTNTAVTSFLTGTIAMIGMSSAALGDGALIEVGAYLDTYFGLSTLCPYATMVTALPDQSGNGYDAGAASGAEPFYVSSRSDYNNKAAVFIPGHDVKCFTTTAGLATAMTAAGACTIFMVGHPTDQRAQSTGTWTSFGAGTNTGLESAGEWYPQSTLGYYAFVYNCVSTAQIPSIIGAVMTGLTVPGTYNSNSDYPAGTDRFYQNSGSPIVKYGNNGAVAPSGAMTIGQYAISPQRIYAAGGALLRILVYSGALTQAQCETVINGLNSLYFGTQIADAWQVFGPAPPYQPNEYGVGAVQTGFVAFAVVRADAFTSTANGRKAGEVFSLANTSNVNAHTCFGLAAATNGTTDYIDAWGYDSGGPTDYDNNLTVVASSWHQVTEEIRRADYLYGGFTSNYVSGVYLDAGYQSPTQLEIGYNANRTDYNYLTLGVGAGSGSNVYFQGGLGFLAIAPTLGMSQTRRRDIDAWVYQTFMFATGFSASISESIGAPTDSVARRFVGARAVAESITAPTDALTRKLVEGRAIAESITAPTDALTRAVAEGRAIAESVTAPTDALTRRVVNARAIAESVTAPTDALARSTVEARAIAESVTAPIDAVVGIATTTRAIAESITAPTDALSRAVVNSRAIAESITAPTDSPARSTVASRAIVESVSAPTDAVVGVPTTSRAIAESVVAPTDALTRATTEGRAIAESVATPTDALTRATVEARAIAESTAAPTDALTRLHTAPRAIAESVTAPTDSLTRSTVASRSIAESVTAPTDALARSTVESRAIAESIAAPTDAVSHAQVLTRAIAESVSVPTDALTRSTGVDRAIAESVSVPTDAVSRVHDIQPRTPNETVAAPTDALARSVVASRSIAESIAAPTDSVVRTVPQHRAPAESVAAPTDAVAEVVHHAFVRAIGEAAGAIDSIHRRIDLIRGQPGYLILENVPAPLDSPERIHTQTRAIAESVAAPTDAVVRATAFLGLVAETIGKPSDSPARSPITTDRALAERVTNPSDAVAMSTGASARSPAESVAKPTDGVTRRIAFYLRGPDESVASPTDALTRLRGILRSIGESVAKPSDAIARDAAHARVVVEDVGKPSDAVLRTIHLVVGIGESIGAPTDSVSIHHVHSPIVLVSESIGKPSDALERATAAARHILESIGAPSDAVVVFSPEPATLVIASRLQTFVSILDRLQTEHDPVDSPETYLGITIEDPDTTLTIAVRPQTQVLMGSIYSEYNVGDVAEVIGSFVDTATGDPVDPSTLSVVYDRPDGTQVTLGYPAAPNLIRDSAGVYRAVLALDIPGRWLGRFSGTGTGAAVQYWELRVRKSLM